MLQRSLYAALLLVGSFAVLAPQEAAAQVVVRTGRPAGVVAVRPAPVVVRPAPVVVRPAPVAVGRRGFVGYGYRGGVGVYRGPRVTAVRRF